MKIIFNDLAQFMANYSSFRNNISTAKEFRHNERGHSKSK